MVKRRAACLSFLPQTLQIVLWREWEKSSTDLSGKEPRQKSLQHQKLHVLAERKWIDAGGNPVVRHEGVPPSNNLIKDGTHRATVFVGPTLKSFSFYFSPNTQRPLWR